MTDSILQRIAAGDQHAVSECLSQYSNLVWSLARRYLGNAAEAEDVVQEIFIEIWSSADRYRPDMGKEITFIATIARRRMIDRIRKHGRTPESNEFDESYAPANPFGAEQLDENVEVHNVVAAMASMDDESRKILSLSIYEGYSHSEIAEQLGMPLGTVKTRVRRGLIQIREQLRLAQELPEESET